MSSRLMERLKKNKGLNSQMMQQQLQQNGQAGGSDSRIWKYTWDEKTKTSVNVIRFLPIPDCDLDLQEKGEIAADVVLSPVALVQRHNFKGPTGRYYNAISPQTWGETCPVREYDRPNWDKQKKTEDNVLKELLKKRIPSTEYYANILVVNDAQNPENNGKVFLFKFGNGIKKVLDQASNPKFPGDPVIDDPYCAFNGAELELSLEGEVRKFNNWEGLVPKDFGRCRWMKPTPLAETEEEMVEILSKCYSLHDFIDRRKMEPYDVLEKRFKEVMGIPVDAPLVDVSAGASQHSSPTDGEKQAPNAALEAQKQLQEAESKRDQGVQTPADQKTDDGSDGGDFDEFLDSLENGE